MFVKPHDVPPLLWVRANWNEISLNSLRPRQNGRHFADDTFKRFFQSENVWISIKIPLKFVPKAPINNIPSLVQIMAWRRPGDKPLYEPMMVNLLTHICVTQPQWVKTAPFHNAYPLETGAVLSEISYLWYSNSLLVIYYEEQETNENSDILSKMCSI